MAERNPLGMADASLSGGLTSPATNASLSGPWAFLVQNAETGVRQQLRVDADAVQLFDTKGNPVADKSFGWSSIKRWAAEQNNVFLFSARMEGGLVDLRLHCDDASAIANACNKGVKLAVAKHKEKQMKKRQLPTVTEEGESEGEGDGGNGDSGQTPPKQVVIRPKVKLLYGRDPKPSAAASPAVGVTPEKEKKKKKSSAPASGNSELWAGNLREKAGSRFSIMTRTKKWFVLKSNGKLRGYHVDPVSGDKKLQSIFTVTKSLMIGANTNGNKVVSMEVDDESKPLGQRGRELQVEAESLDEADKLAKALAFCLSAGEREKRPAEPAGGAVKPKPTSPAPPRAPLADQGAGEDEGSSSSSERGEDCDDDHDRGEVASPPKSNLKTLRQRNSLLGSSPLMADSLLGGDQVLPRSLALPRPEAAEAAAMVEAATPASSSEEEEEEDDSPIGKEIPDVRAPAARAAPSPSPSPSAQHLAEGLGQMQQLLIEQLAKRVDQLEGELRAQRGQIGAVEERQREQAMRPAPQPQRPAADPSAAMENFQQWGEIELLGTRMDRLEYQFEDLKVSFNAIVNDLTQNLMSIRDVLIVSSPRKDEA